MQSDGAAAIANAEEIAFWNSEAGERWAAYAERTDAAFAPLGAAALAAAAPAQDEAVIDVGCGAGATVLALANAVGPHGRVAGVDVSAPLLAAAKRRIDAAGLDNVGFLLADAAVYAFEPAGVDLVFSRFGVMFFDDPVLAFANLRRAMKRDGRLAFACWRTLRENAWFELPLVAVKPHVPPQPPVDPSAPGPLAFADPDRVRSILGDAGFAGVDLQAYDAALTFGDRTAALETLSNIGPVARLLADADDAQRNRAREALDRTLRAHESGDGVRLGAGIWIVTAVA